MRSIIKRKRQPKPVRMPASEVLKLKMNIEATKIITTDKGIMA